MLSTMFSKGQCYDKVQKGSPGFTLTYCNGNTLILILSFINTVIFSLFLIFHLRYKGVCVGRTYTKNKTWMLFMIVILEASVMVRYLFVFDETPYYDMLLIISGFIQSIIFFLICYFFTKKAAFYLDESQTIRKYLQIMFLVSVLVFAGLMVFQFFDKTVTDKPDNQLCKTPYFLIPAFVNQIINIIFFILGFKISSTITLYNQH